MVVVLGPKILSYPILFAVVLTLLSNIMSPKNKTDITEAKEQIVAQQVIASKEPIKKANSKLMANNNTPKVIFHKVQQGDTLWNIAQRYRTTIQEIKRANRINSNQIKIGVSIKVPVVS